MTTIGDLAQLEEAQLRGLFGKHGAGMARRARGLDNRPVEVEHERKSVSQERTFSNDIQDLQELKRWLWRMSQGVARHLQRHGIATATVAIKLRYADFTTLTRQTTLPVPTDDAVEIYRVALLLLERNWQQGRPVRLLGVGAQQLTELTGQLPLFDPSDLLG